jgi:hypothetical protein
VDKLYRVILRGMQSNLIGVAYGASYVVAKSADAAYRKVRAALDKEDIGFLRERELERVELIATKDGSNGTPLFAGRGGR